MWLGRFQNSISNRGIRYSEYRLQKSEIFLGFRKGIFFWFVVLNFNIEKEFFIFGFFRSTNFNGSLCEQVSIGIKLSFMRFKILRLGHLRRGTENSISGPESSVSDRAVANTTDSFIWSPFGCTHKLTG